MTAPGKQFFDQHMQYIAEGKIDEMVENDYHEDAVLTSFFYGLDTPPPLIIKGHDQLKKFFHDYLNLIGQIDIETLDFTEEYDGNEGATSLQASFTCNLGKIKTADAWTMKQGKVAYHFGFFFPEET